MKIIQVRRKKKILGRRKIMGHCFPLMLYFSYYNNFSLSNILVACISDLYQIFDSVIHETRRTDTDPNGYRDFCAKLIKKIPVSFESGAFLVPRSVLSKSQIQILSVSTFDHYWKHSCWGYKNFLILTKICFWVEFIWLCLCLLKWGGYFVHYKQVKRAAVPSPLKSNRIYSLLSPVFRQANI